MDLAIIGYGRMGQHVAQLAHAQGHNITHRINDQAALQTATFQGDEVAVVFTPPAACVSTIQQVVERGLTTVVGTTGWYERLEDVHAMVAMHGTGLLWSANFSIGVHLFWQALRHVAQTLHSAPTYDVYGYEVHHSGKVDAPSGTALQTADLLVQHFPRKTTLVTHLPERALYSEEFHWGSVRGGAVAGTHAVVFDSACDSIELRHTARSRAGFAEGALAAAAWLRERTGCYSMDDFMAEAFFSPSTNTNP